MSKAVAILKHLDMPKQPGLYGRLICLTGANKGKAYFIKGKRAILGRSEDVDIQVLDIKTSRNHAEIVKIGDDYVLTDLNSQNGVIVNRLKVKQHKLQNKDKVVIGQTVYSFESVTIEPPLPEVNVTDDEIESIDEEFDDESENKDKKRSKILFVVVGIALLLLLFSEDEATPKKKANLTQISTASDDLLIKKVMKKNYHKNKELKIKLSSIYKNGLREYREGNYYRAIAEFNMALIVNPEDPLADFYLKRTKKALDTDIQDLFIKAKRESDSLKYNSSIVLICKIQRLLITNKEDPRFKQAEEMILKLEEKLGKEKGEISCL